ncbi:MAG: class I SAM-dependent methyltransferase, partial [bacterium]
MRDEKGFDAWAERYDAFVDAREREEGYPFGGYHAIQDAIVKEAEAWEKPLVLDLGFGTGRLTSRLYDRG